MQQVHHCMSIESPKTRCQKRDFTHQQLCQDILAHLLLCGIGLCTDGLSRSVFVLEGWFLAHFEARIQIYAVNTQMHEHQAIWNLPQRDVEPGGGDLCTSTSVPRFLAHLSSRGGSLHTDVLQRSILEPKSSNLLDW